MAKGAIIRSTAHSLSASYSAGFNPMDPTHLLQEILLRWSIKHARCWVRYCTVKIAKLSGQ